MGKALSVDYRQLLERDQVFKHSSSLNSLCSPLQKSAGSITINRSLQLLTLKELVYTTDHPQARSRTSCDFPRGAVPYLQQTRSHPPEWNTFLVRSWDYSWYLVCCRALS